MMRMKTKIYTWSCLLCLLFPAVFSTGCATSSQLRELEMKVDQISQESQHAADMAKDIESKCMDLSKDATEEFRGAGAAADRAERGASKAESMADMAEKAADRAEAAAEKVQKMYDRMMAK